MTANYDQGMREAMKYLADPNADEGTARALV